MPPPQLNNTNLEQTMFCALEVEMSRLKWAIRIADRNAITQHIDALMCLCTKLGEVNEKTIKKQARPMLTGRNYLLADR